jgi:hypothetical protein
MLPSYERVLRQERSFGRAMDNRLPVSKTLPPKN